MSIEMPTVLIISDNKKLVTLWSDALLSTYTVFSMSVSDTYPVSDATIIDTFNIDDDPLFLSAFNTESAPVLVIGASWPEEKQIAALVQGVAGYCGESEPPELLLKAIECIIKGDIWIQRNLVPRVIGSLVQKNNRPDKREVTEATLESLKRLKTLSKRERDVANMIRNGENNKRIASAMGISERTVKAHLTSIFKKLNLHDRLHLALFIKEYD